MTETVYFASDTHFGAMAAPRERARIERFLNWLQGLEDGSELILLGDIFDFWLDYPTFMPKTHLEILYGLRKLQDRGCRISFVGGNHDIWCADFLREQLDIPILAGGTVIERQGRKLRLDHGDGILSGDIFYRGFRAAVRNPLLVFLAKSLHPEIRTGSPTSFPTPRARRAASGALVWTRPSGVTASSTITRTSTIW